MYGFFNCRTMVVVEMVLKTLILHYDGFKFNRLDNGFPEPSEIIMNLVIVNLIVGGVYI